MKILQVIGSFPPAYSYGGPQNVAYEVSKALIKRGHEVTVYTTDVLDAKSRASYNNPVLMDGIVVYHFKNLSNYLAYYCKISSAIGIALKLRKDIENYDVLHVHDFRSVESAIACHYAVRHKVPYVLQTHGTLRSDNKKSLKRLFDALFGNRILKNASYVIAITKKEARQCKDCGIEADRILLIPNGIDYSLYMDLPARNEFKARYGINRDDIVILYLGRLDKTNKVDILLRAFSLINRQVSNSKLVIAGPDNGALTELKELSLRLGEENVIFTGKLPESDKIKAYADADVFVTPSYSGFPVTFLEAMASGLPVVTTKDGDELDWLERAGFIAEPDAVDLSDKILKIINDRALHDRFGKEGKRLAEDKFCWDNIIVPVESAYMNSADKRCALE